MHDTIVQSEETKDFLILALCDLQKAEKRCSAVYSYANDLIIKAQKAIRQAKQFVRLVNKADQKLEIAKKRYNEAVHKRLLEKYELPEKIRSYETEYIECEHYPGCLENIYSQNHHEMILHKELDEMLKFDDE